MAKTDLLDEQKPLSVLSDKGVSSVLHRVLSFRHDCRGRQIFCRSCLRFLARFCRNKLSWCQQCAQTDRKTVRTVMASRFPTIKAPTTPTRLVSLQTIAYIHALGIHSHTYMMPSKPLAAKASVFNGNFVDDVASTVATEAESYQTSPKTEHTMIFIKGWASSLATLRTWRVHLGFVRTSPAGGESAKEMSSTRLRRRSRHQPLLRQQPGRMVPAPPTSLPRLRPVSVLKLAPMRPARAPCRARRLLSQAAGRG